MNSSFYNGISGVKSGQFGIDVWADNIANVNTVGYKSLTPEFSNLFSITLNSSNSAMTTTDSKGLGSSSQTTAMNQTIGSFMPSDNKYDLAISGNGWFSVSSNSNQYFTRAGAFHVDSNGYLVDGGGNYLLGTSGGNIGATTLSPSVTSQFGNYSVNGNLLTPLSDAYTVLGMQSIILGPPDSQTPIKLPDMLYYPAVATTEVTYKANLDPTTNYKNQAIFTQDFTDVSIEIENGLLNFSANLINLAVQYDLKVGDEVEFSLEDEDGNELFLSAILDEDYNIVVTDALIDPLNPTSKISLYPQAELTQEILNTDRFMSSIISPEGDRDVVDLAFVKQPTQANDGSSVWSVTAQVLRFFEAYDASKIYDPDIYYVDEPNKKVYEIIDKKFGEVAFGDNGTLKSSTVPTLSNSGSPLELNFGTIGGFDGLTANAALKVTRNITADGTPSGILDDYNVSSTGSIFASFTNGKSVEVAKIALYHFQNEQGLSKVGNTLYQQSANSGEAFFYVDSNGNYYNGTSIASNFLESSNTNLNTALTELIVIQKSFDASAKSITTSDEMIQNAINMKK